MRWLENNREQERALTDIIRDLAVMNYCGFKRGIEPFPEKEYTMYVVEY